VIRDSGEACGKWFSRTPAVFVWSNPMIIETNGGADNQHKIEGVLSYNHDMLRITGTSDEKMIIQIGDDNILVYVGGLRHCIDMDGKVRTERCDPGKMFEDARTKAFEPID
jgi:hypothetical protein